LIIEFASRVLSNMAVGSVPKTDNLPGKTFNTRRNRNAGSLPGFQLIGGIHSTGASARGNQLLIASP